jgi:hypothetical protein
MQLQSGYKEGGKTGSYAAADRIQAGRKDRRAMQLQTRYSQGGKTGSYTAAEGRKEGELCSCRHDTIREEREKQYSYGRRAELRATPAD